MQCLRCHACAGTTKAASEPSQSAAQSHGSRAALAWKSGRPSPSCHQTGRQVGPCERSAISHTEEGQVQFKTCHCLHAQTGRDRANWRGGHCASEAREKICCLPGSGRCSVFSKRLRCWPYLQPRHRAWCPVPSGCGYVPVTSVPGLYLQSGSEGGRWAHF